MSRTHFYTFEHDDAEVTVEYSITPYDPGVSSGPAEICYPPEGGEVDIIKAFTEGLENFHLSDDEIEVLHTKIFEEHVFDDDRGDVDYHYD